MIQLNVAPAVLAALKAAFPKPANCAERAMNKYITKLSQLIQDASMRERTAWQVKKGIYDISTHELSQKGGQIGRDKIRLHKWLHDNGWDLVQVVTAGSNLSGKVSQVKLTANVTLTDPWADLGARVETVATDADFEKMVNGSTAENKVLLSNLYPDLAKLIAANRVDDVFDRLSVNRPSLKAYIYWLCTEAKHIPAVKRDIYMRHALTILQAANALGGEYLQQRKPSSFGRNYYAGLSIQNVNKELRRAVLGHCWEYDVRSAVIAWKLGFAANVAELIFQNSNVSRAFPMSLGYVKAKEETLADIRREVFDGYTALDREGQVKMIKQAFTAIAFGARLSRSGWLTKDGTWNNPALVTIIKDAGLRAKFTSALTVKSFIKEQDLLDGYIVDLLKMQRPDLVSLDELCTPTGRPLPSKLIAYFYQHVETKAMQALIDLAKKRNRQPLAVVHDAVFFRQKLGAETMFDCQEAMREATGNPYWSLSWTEHQPYRRYSLDELAEEVAHKQRMAVLEAYARTYISPNFEKSELGLGLKVK